MKQSEEIILECCDGDDMEQCDEKGLEYCIGQGTL